MAGAVKDTARNRAGQSGMTLIEVSIAAALSLVVMLGVYELFDRSKVSYMRETDLAQAQNTGRVAMDLLSSQLRSAGYNPLGSAFWAIPEGTASRIRLTVDRDADGIVKDSSEDEEYLSFWFKGPDAGGLYRLVRGIDINNNWNFTDDSKSELTVARYIVPVDMDGDGVAEPFFAYDVAPPATPTTYDPELAVPRRVTVTFGVRTARTDRMTGEYRVVSFQSAVAIRNGF